jgi:hypothetical protein
MPAPLRMNRGDAIIAGGLSLALAVLLVPCARLGVDPHHDGIMLKPALDVLAGQTLFRDTFMQYGALTCYLQVVALWVEPSLLSVKFMTVAAYAVTVFFLFAAWRCVLPRSLALLSAGLFILFIPGYETNLLGQYWIMLPWSSVFALMFQSIGLYALFRVIRAEQPDRWAWVLGAACACVFWCRQPVGLVMFGCLAVIWLVLLQRTDWMPAPHTKRAILIRLAGGFLAVNLLLLGGIGLSGALPEWWYQNFVWPRKWVQGSMGWSDLMASGFVHPAAAASLGLLLLAVAFPSWGRRFHLPFGPRSVIGYYLGLGGVLVWQHERVFQALALREGGWTIVFPLVLGLQAALCLVQAVVPGRPPRTTEHLVIAASAVFSLGSLVQYYPIPDAWHILWSLAPAFGLHVYLWWRFVGWPAPVVAAVLTVGFVPSLWAKVQTGAEALDRPLVTLTQPAVLRGMRVPPAAAHTIGRIVDTLQPVLRHRPDIPAALIGDDALWLCLTRNLTNPTPYFVTWRRLADNEENQRRWNYIAHVRPVMFLQKARWEAVDDFYRRAHYVPLLYLPEEALEVAVPQEVAEAVGLTAYGSGPERAKATKSSVP